MKKIIALLFICSLFSNYSSAQVVAFPAENSSRNWGSQCVDLHFTNLEVIGHQNDVNVSYFENLSDAQNETNQLDRFFEPSSNPQTIYARVGSTINSDFAIADVIISWSTSFPPAGISPCEYELCDINSDGTEIAYLNNLKCDHNAHTYDVPFCSSADAEIEMTYYLSEADANSETNAINSDYPITGTTTIYTKLKNTTTNQSYIDGFITINLITCTLDSDGDGIFDKAEDPNNNLVNDDDTDQDGLKNFEDNDDDGDGILTINEDYNNNGDPTDDDTNSNGVADYLEASVTLSVNSNNLNTIFKVYPNPVQHLLTVESKNAIDSITLYNNLGQTVLKNKKETTINISDYESGLYFIKIQDIFGHIEIKKFIKE